MSYTEDQVKKYLEILHNYTKKPVEEVIKINAVIVKIVIVLLLILDIKYVITVEQQMVMFWVSMMLKITIDYIFEKRVFIRESITMRKRLIKFLKE